ncbi:ganglioside GM2 activator-like isoform X1 [Argopecten irradians]|uniref:ganglioside GM2 activator-like isoform X1 n=1 Tax=Argopecten irradians TaxID=31199 RepID=UPI0037147D5C
MDFVKIILGSYNMILHYNSIMKKQFFPLALILIAGVSVCVARRKREKPELRFTDCGKNPHRPIFFYDFKANPIPIITPGTLYVSMAGNISYDLPRRISIKLEVKKYFIGIAFLVPCFDSNIGSCTYDNICANLETFERRQRCPKRLRNFNIQCHCPFQAGEFNFKDLALNIPKIGGFAGAFVKVRGDYEVVFKVLDENTEELGCLNLRFTIKRRHKGWLFKI